jgi:hypothetical protein
MNTRLYRALASAYASIFCMTAITTCVMSLPAPAAQSTPLPGDFDQDGDVDGDDVAYMGRARTGPGIPMTTSDPALRRADLDNDGDVDQDDFGILQVAYTGATAPRDGKVYYVALNGNDNWSGLKQDPAGSDGPFRTIQKAARVAEAGATIYIRGGIHDLAGQIIAFTHSGEPGAPITLAGMPGEQVEIRSSGSKPIFDFSTVYDNQTAGFGWYVFRNFKLSGGRYGWWISPPFPANWDPAQHSLDALLVDQIHDITIEDVEVDGNGKLETAIYVRNGGIRNLTVRRCRFHHTIGTEGTVDIGEWRDEHPAHAIPKSASHNLRFEDCDFYNAVHQQANGIVTQPCVYDVTFVRCRAFNNGKYGFACKGSDNFRLDRCMAWGNDSTQMYCRGFGGDSGAERDAFPSRFLITNSIFIAPADQRGGSAVNWRENTNLSMYNCTIIGLRDGSYGESGGYAFLCGNAHAIPCKADIRNCIIAGYTSANSMRMMDSDPTGFLLNTRYEADNNLFLGSFRYMTASWATLDKWQQFWAMGAPNGDDGLNGPKATFADTHSRQGDPQFVRMNPAQAPLRKAWSANPWDSVDLHVRSVSPAVNGGQNLSDLNIPELMTDYEGKPRPQNGAWTIGAMQTVVQ